MKKTIFGSIAVASVLLGVILGWLFIGLKDYIVSSKKENLERVETLSKTFNIFNKVKFDLSTTKMSRYFQIESFVNINVDNKDVSLSIDYTFSKLDKNVDSSKILYSDKEYLVVKNLKKCSDKDIDIFEINKTNEQISICENEKLDGAIILTLLSR